MCCHFLLLLPLVLLLVVVIYFFFFFFFLLSLPAQGNGSEDEADFCGQFNSSFLPAIYPPLPMRLHCSTYQHRRGLGWGWWGSRVGGVRAGGCLAVDFFSPKCHLLHLASASSRREDLPASVGHMGKYLQGVGGEGRMEGRGLVLWGCGSVRGGEVCKMLM